MRASARSYDVLIVHSWNETRLANEVAGACRNSGLEAITDNELAAGLHHSEATWEALAECQAVVILLSATTPSANMTFEIGAALAWNKPLFGIVADTISGRAPFALSELPVYPFSRLQDVIDAIRASIRQLTDADRSLLLSIYTEIGVPLDRLDIASIDLESIVDRFNEGRVPKMSGERLLAELMRLRKQAKLPKLRQKKSTRRLSPENNPV